MLHTQTKNNSKEKTASATNCNDYRPGTGCNDCGRETVALPDFEQYYMVKDDLWAKFGVDGLLCIPCLQARMERCLRWSDFSPCPLSAAHLLEHGHNYQDDLADLGNEENRAQFLAAVEQLIEYFSPSSR